MGWNISGPTGYFSNTNFPVEIDQRCFMGNEINAHCIGDGLGGIGHVGYGIMDTTDSTAPRTRLRPVSTGTSCAATGSSTRPSENLTSASLTALAILCRASTLTPTRTFAGSTAPPKTWRPALHLRALAPSLDRRYDRDVAAGWAWGGSRDNGGYGSRRSWPRRCSACTGRSAATPPTSAAAGSRRE